MAAGFGVWIANAVILWLAAAPLGHDEAQYAMAARDMLEGGEARWFYLSNGMSALAIPGIVLGSGELALRFLPLVFGIGFVFAVWQLARRTVGDAAAAWAVAVLAGSRNIVKWSTDLLSDMPAATCLLAAAAVIITEVTRTEGVRWRVILAAPLLAAGFYIRYGSCVPIAIIVIAALAIGWRSIKQRPAPVIVTAAVFVGLLVPHFAMAIGVTGSPLGILLESRTVPQQAYPGEGLVTYATSNPFMFYGIPTPLVLLAGLAAVVRKPDRRGVFLWVISVASIVAIGLTTHAQIRYIFFGLAGLVILGTDTILRGLASLTPPLRTILAWAAALVVATSWVLVTVSLLRYPAQRRDGTRATLLAATAIRAQARKPCYIYGAHYTQLEVYSGCRSASSPPDAEVASGAPVYVVTDHSPGWQPEAVLPGHPHAVLDVPGVVRVVRHER
ncbi:MAG: glycosyltransferase family 39 protein [Deltaproteobacteria bacterium]|nr:glycosyltransferase family 39 protein [Deltaproteobacteria bacterium]